MNSLDFVAVDTETTGLQPGYHEICQVGAVAFNARTLEPYPAEEGGTFESLMKPQHFDRIQDQALRVNGLTREQLAAAPDAGPVWNKFIQWVKGFNKKGGIMSAPIAIMKNGRDFDMKFIADANAQYASGDKTVLFNRRRFRELEDQLFDFFENTDELENFKMDTFRAYAGLTSEKSHSALQDAYQTGVASLHFLKIIRELRRKKTKDGSLLIPLKGCLKGH